MCVSLILTFYFFKNKLIIAANEKMDEMSKKGKG
jgi:hypothetical protein